MRTYITTSFGCKGIHFPPHFPTFPHFFLSEKMQKIPYLRKFSLKVQLLEHFSVYLHAVRANREKWDRLQRRLLTLIAF